MFSVEGTQSVFCFLLKVLYSICFLFSVEGTQSVFCCRYSVLNLFSFSVVGTQCFLFSVVGLNLFSVFC